jgi:hypothetical protein
MKFSGPQSPAGRRVFTLPGALACATALFLAMAAPSWAQNGGVSIRSLEQPVGGGINDISSGSPLDDEKVLSALNADRQKALISDTNKLIRLVNNLNDEIARSEPASLTSTQLRKMAEIEKLARDVKEKMRQSVRGMPAYHQPSIHIR